MKNLNFIIAMCFFCLIIASCSSDKKNNSNDNKPNEKESMSSKINMLESEIMKNFDEKKVSELIKLCLDYEKKFPQDSLVPYFLYKAGANFSYLNKPYDALRCFDRVYKLFPDYDKAPVSLFHIAGIYSDMLNDTASARETYNTFILKYPNHKLVEDARLSIENLGKSLEELVEEWEKNEAADSLISNI